MRLRNRPWAKPELANCPYFIQDAFAMNGKWRSFFSEEHPIHLEIGCGKGLYLSHEAPLHPQINYIGADIKDLMLAYARRNLEAAFEASGSPVANCALVSLDAERIGQMFSKEDGVQRIIINFPNPWPKDAHKKRRLTHPRQLIQYRQFLADDGEILFKTDNRDIFEDSVDYFHECDYSIVELDQDYYEHREIPWDSLTEHEEKFLKQGDPIYYLKAKK